MLDVSIFQDMILFHGNFISVQRPCHLKTEWESDLGDDSSNSERVMQMDLLS